MYHRFLLKIFKLQKKIKKSAMHIPFILLIPDFLIFTKKVVCVSVKIIASFKCKSDCRLLPEGE